SNLPAGPSPRTTPASSITTRSSRWRNRLCRKTLSGRARTMAWFTSRATAASLGTMRRREMPEWSLVSLIEASPHDAAKAYLAVDTHKLDIYRPYIFRTNDFGKTWTKIVAGLPENTYVHAVREDPRRRGLLFAGTETGVFVSFD